MSDTNSSPAPPTKPEPNQTQPNGAGSVLVGTSGAAVVAWVYSKLSHGDQMPADVAMQMTGLMIVAMHGIQTAVLWWLNRRTSK